MVTVGTKKPLNTNVQNEEHSLDPADPSHPSLPSRMRKKGLRRASKV
jgi:tetrahydromethanopterin S-methyltransferase subunit B